jgi:hypothetical protein
MVSLFPSTKEQQPERECEKRSQTWVDNDKRRKLPFEIHAHKESSDDSGEQYANDRAEKPGREK